MKNRKKYTFDCCANQVVHFLLLKSAVALAVKYRGNLFVPKSYVKPRQFLSAASVRDYLSYCSSSWFFQLILPLSLSTYLYLSPSLPLSFFQTTYLPFYLSIYLSIPTCLCLYLYISCRPGSCFGLLGIFI